MERTVSAISRQAAEAVQANSGSILPDPAYPQLLVVTFDGVYVTERYTSPAANRSGSWTEDDYRLTDGTMITICSHRSPNGYGRSCIVLAEARQVVQEGRR
jgi:hypothetical protein